MTMVRTAFGVARTLFVGGATLMAVVVLVGGLGIAAKGLADPVSSANHTNILLAQRHCSYCQKCRERGLKIERWAFGGGPLPCKVSDGR